MNDRKKVYSNKVEELESRLITYFKHGLAHLFGRDDLRNDVNSCKNRCRQVQLLLTYNTHPQLSNQSILTSATKNRGLETSCLCDLIIRFCILKVCRPMLSTMHEQVNASFQLTTRD